MELSSALIYSKFLMKHGIEQAVRNQMQKHVMPQVGVFLSQQLQAQPRETAAPSKASLDNCPSQANKPRS